MKHILKTLILILVLSSVGCKDDKDKTDNKKELIDDYSTEIDSLIETKNPRFFNGV